MVNIANQSQLLLGHYSLIRFIGKGGYAAVYQCEHRYIGTLAAIRVLRAGMDGIEESNFHVEAYIAASLVHVHIIRVLEFGVEGRRPYLVMDYALNGTIRQLYPWRSRMIPRALVKYVEQIADALQYVHNKGLVHRDIKPENLLLGDNNQLLLSDFGNSITVHDTSSSKEVITGTAAYMAPETIEGEACFTSDQYTLVICAYPWRMEQLPCFAMSYAPNGSLRNRYQRGTQVAWQIWILHEILSDHISQVERFQVTIAAGKTRHLVKSEASYYWITLTLYLGREYRCTGHKGGSEHVNSNITARILNRDKLIEKRRNNYAFKH